MWSPSETSLRHRRGGSLHAHSWRCSNVPRRQRPIRKTQAYTGRGQSSMSAGEVTCSGGQREAAVESLGRLLHQLGALFRNRDHVLNIDDGQSHQDTVTGLLQRLYRYHIALTLRRGILHSFGENFTALSDE